jgi:hypothetical protein
MNVSLVEKKNGAVVAGSLRKKQPNYERSVKIDAFGAG